MLVVFANNQTLVAPSGGTTEIFTDPVPLNGNSRASAMLNIHSIFGTGATLAYELQGSNDGVNFVAQGPSDSETAAGVSLSPTSPAPVSLAFVRARMTLTNAGALSGVCFDLHVNFDSN